MKSMQRLTTCLTIFCLLSSFISVSDNPSSPLSLLAPAAEELAFKLTHKQKKQIEQLIKTLDRVEPFTKCRYAGTFWLTEYTLATYQEKIQNPNSPLIPRLGFYDFLGGKNREELRKLLTEAIKKNKPLPKKLELTCNSLYDEPVGLYWFLASIHAFKEEELKLFESVEIGSFHRDLSPLNMPKDHLNKTLAKLTGDDLKKGVIAFHFYGKKAAEIADLLFQEKNPAAADLKYTLIKRALLFKELCAEIAAFAGTIDYDKGDDSARRQLLLKINELNKIYSNYSLLQDLNKATQDQDLNALQQLKQKIQEHYFPLEQDNRKKVNFINLPALVQNQIVEQAVLVGITKIELNLEALLTLAQKPDNKLAGALLTYLQKPPDQINATEAAGLSESFASLSEGDFDSDSNDKKNSLLFLLLQILAKTHQLPPSYDQENPKDDYREIIQKNIFTLLQKKRPNWFQESLCFLNEENAVEGMASFLETTGWIDGAIHWDLSEKKTSLTNLKTIETLLKNRIVATAETVSFRGTPEQLEMQINAQIWPKNRKVSSRWDQLCLFNFLKRKLFFSEPTFDAATLPFVFLPLETFQGVADAAQSMECLPMALAKELGLKKVNAQTRSLHRHTFIYFLNAYEQDPLKGALYAAYDFYEKMKKVLAHLESTSDRLYGLKKIMTTSGIAKKEIEQFFRYFFYYHVEQKIKKELSLLNGLIPKIDATVDLTWLQALLKKLEQLEKTDDAYSYAYFYVNDLVQANPSKALILGLTSIELLFEVLGNAGKIKNPPLALLKKLRKQDNELAYSLGLELLREKIAEAKLMPAVLRFPLLEGSLKTLFETYLTSEDALEAAENGEPKIDFLSPIINPISFVKKYAPLFELNDAEKNCLILALAKNLTPLLLSVNSVEQSIVNDLRHQFQQQASFPSILKSTEKQIQSAPRLLLTQVEQAPYLTEISQKLGLKEKIKNLHISSSYDYQYEKSKQVLDSLNSSTEEPRPFIQELLSTTLIAPYAAQIQKLLSLTPTAALEESL